MWIACLGSEAVDRTELCADGACPAVPDRPVVAWTAPQTVRADEVVLFSRGEGATRLAIAPVAGPHEREVLVIAPAGERVGTVLAIRVRELRAAR